MAISGDSFMGRLVLLFRFLELDLVNLDPHLRVGERWVVSELVGLINIPTLRLLAENSVFGACKRLERPRKLFVS